MGLNFLNSLSPAQSGALGCNRIELQNRQCQASPMRNAIRTARATAPIAMAAKAVKYNE